MFVFNVFFLPSNSSNLRSALINIASIESFSLILSWISSHLLILSFNDSTLRSQLSMETSYFSLISLFFSYSSNSFFSCTKPCSLMDNSVINLVFSSLCRLYPSSSAIFALVIAAFINSIPQCSHLIPPSTEDFNLLIDAISVSICTDSL